MFHSIKISSRIYSRPGRNQSFDLRGLEKLPHGTVAICDVVPDWIFLSFESDLAFNILTTDSKGRFRAASRSADVWRKMAKKIVGLARKGSGMYFSSKVIRCVSAGVPECARSSDLPTKDCRDDRSRSSAATMMPEMIDDESSWPEELDDGAQQMSAPNWSRRLCDWEPEAVDKQNERDDEVQLVHQV